MADDRQIDEDELDRRIAAAKKAEQRLSGSQPAAAEGKVESRGWAIGVEFVGAVLVSTLIGFFLDRWLGTKPWLMILFLLLGFAAGLRRAIVTSSKFDADSTNDRN